MENKTVWSVICDSAFVLPPSLGWVRKTSNSRLTKKAHKDVYKLNELANCYLLRLLVNVMEIVHCCTFEHFCLQCRGDFPDHQLTQTRGLLNTFESLKESFSEKELKDREFHWDMYIGAQWAKTETVGEFIERVNKNVCRYNTCTKHTTANKVEKLNGALQKIFREQLEGLVLLSVSSNYEENSCHYYDSPRKMSTRIPLRILASVSSAIHDIEYFFI
jgi:hypothetical protein